MVDKIVSEKERRKKLADALRKDGWEVYEEVYCDKKEINKRGKFRLDIMGRPPNASFFIGFELKLYDGCRQGGKFFEALQQTLDYQEEYFRGHKINIWCVDLYKENSGKWSDDTFNSSWIFMQSFLQKLGIGMIASHVYSEPYSNHNYETIIFLSNDGKYNHCVRNGEVNQTDWNSVYKRGIEKRAKISFGNVKNGI